MITQQEQIKQYYLKISGFSDVVASLIPELEGLNTENYFNWYFTKSRSHYYRNSVWSASNPLMKYGAKNRAGVKLTYRREPRMYVRRKLIKRKQDAIHYYKHFKQVFNNVYAHQRRVCNDAKLVLATTLHDFAIELTKDIAVLRQCRLGLDLDRSHKTSLFRGISDNDEDATGKRVARIEFFRQILAEFEQQVIQTPQAPSQQPQPSTSTKQFISDICRPPFSQDEFSELLVRLGVIDSEGNCLINHLKGPARSKRSVFTAAYRVLHRAELLEPVLDSQLGEILRNTYGVEMGPDVLSRELTGKGMAPSETPKDFIRAVDTCKEWLEERKIRLNPTNNAR